MCLGLRPCVLMAAFLKTRESLRPHQIPFAATVSEACGSVTEMFMVFKFIEPEIIDSQVYRMYNILVAVWELINQLCGRGHS